MFFAQNIFCAKGYFRDIYTLLSVVKTPLRMTKSRDLRGGLYSDVAIFRRPPDLRGGVFTTIWQNPGISAGKIFS